MQQTAEFLFAIGGILLLGLATDFVGKRTFLPRVTLLLILGILVGNQVLDLIPASVTSRFGIITDLALLMIGFLLGGKLTLQTFRSDGRSLIAISVAAALCTTLLVTAALYLSGLPLQIAIPLGCIAAATAPVATVDTVLESGSQSRFSRLLLAVVAIDDVWALILFSLGIALMSTLGDVQDLTGALLGAVYELGGGLMLGLVIGLPAAYLTGRLRPGQPMLIEALGLVFICGGAALWLELPFIIAAMAMGAAIANLARHHDYPFHEIENIEWPFMVIFFVLAGASLEIGMLTQMGLIGVVYLLARVVGKLAGGWFGAVAGGAEPEVRRWMGAALLPQAGVAIGLALLAAHRFPEYRQIILSLVISTTVIFELIGPVFTRLALRRTDRPASGQSPGT